MRRPHAIAIPALCLGAYLLVPTPGPAQPPPPDQPDLTIDADDRREVVEGVIKHLDEAYVFPETASKMAEALRERMEDGSFDDLDGAKGFARRLTEELRVVSKDKHLGVTYHAGPIPEESGDRPRRSPEQIERMKGYGAAVNYGFEKVERMGGNVGYLDLRGFFPAEYGGETAAAAMNFVANADALIIDLRQNGGGDPSMVALVCSYLFGPEPVHLNDLYFRPDDSTHQWWTLPYVPGRRFEGKPVYVLTSGRTFSAAEEFAYNLKNLERAKLVGETTGGGAHPGGRRRINDHFSMFVPSGRAINPISKTNWEGTGVEPDLSVPADLALKAAYLDALEGILEAQAGNKDVDPLRMRQIEEKAGSLRKELEEARAEGPGGGGRDG